MRSALRGWLIVLLLLTGSLPAVAAEVRLVWTGPVAASDQEQRWLEEDTRWLSARSSLPPIATLLPDSSDSLRRLVRGLAVVGDKAPSLSRESAIRQRWMERGYLAAEVQSPGGAEKDAIRLTVDAGRRYRIETFEIGGADFPGRDRILEIWLPRPGDDFDPSAIENGVERVLQATAEEGFPFARWVISSGSIDDEAAMLSLEARLLPGHRSVLGPITSDLPLGPGRRFLVKASGLRSGSVFSESDLRRAKERLLARDLYQRVDDPGVYLTSSVDTVGVHFPVEPRAKVNRVQVVLGLSRKDDESGSRLSGQVDLNLPNLAGTGRRLSVGWSDDGAEKSRFGFSYLEPLAFGTPLDMAFALEHEVATDLFTRFRIENNWSLPVVALWGVNLGLGWDRSTFPVGDLEGSRRSRILGAIEHRRGDRARSGWLGRVGVETAWRSSTPRIDEETDTVGPRLGEGITQRILLGDLGGERWFGTNLSLAARGSFRQLRGSEETAPLSEQFRFGGANTLRGYREEEFHGTSTAWSSLELRIGRPRGSRLYTFLDVGYFEFSALDPLSDEPERRSLKKDWPWGFGLGLLARTVGGDLSLAIGFPESVDFQIAKLHVSLMESF